MPTSRSPVEAEGRKRLRAGGQRLSPSAAQAGNTALASWPIGVSATRGQRTPANI